MPWRPSSANGELAAEGVIEPHHLESDEDQHLHIHFTPTSLFNSIVMLVLLVGGLALIARALRAQGGVCPQSLRAALETDRLAGMKTDTYMYARDLR